ncbi:MAG: trypsin-like peptidase domain-containing protein [Actinomycetota bacterium]|nr:trypsin-like peptidase domain-containing protein [Actinomycetota bacterium]
MSDQPGDHGHTHRFPTYGQRRDPFGPPPVGYAAPPSPYAAPQAAPSRRRSAGILAAAVLVGGLAGVGGAAGYDTVRSEDPPGGDRSTSLQMATPSSVQSAQDDSVEAVAARLLPSVVKINVAGRAGVGNGTGIIMSADGQILTNNHVVEPAGEGGTITVLFGDGSTADAQIVGRDPVTDLAVIEAQGVDGLTPASFGSSGELAIGEQVVAIGSPFGLQSTVTTGIVSALNRPVTSGDGQGGDTSVFPAVQTDAAINPGNSGGPLVDMSGNVIGINSAIQTGTSDAGGGSIGLGFAIPVDLARSISDQIVAGEIPTHAKIGVVVTNAVTTDRVTTVGALVEEVVPDSAGESGGLEVGDVVTAVDAQQVDSSDALVALIRAYRPGDEVTLAYLRDDEPGETDVTLDSDGGQLAP